MGSLAIAALWLVAQPVALDRDEVIRATMRPYDGPTVSGVDRKTLAGKVLVGYQGWFATPTDGADMGWFHWARRDFGPNDCLVEMWPDVSELDPDERYATGFRYPGGRPAEVFSSYNRKTVMRHFKWMADYGIDGAFVQRFGVRIQKPVDLRFTTTVLAHCRAGANAYGRTYAVMYDLTGLPAGGTQAVQDDWKLLRGKMRITQDPAYLTHKGKPVVAIWGIGFRDGRQYTLDDCRRLVEFFKSDRRYGGVTLMVGVPTYWRTLHADAVADEKLHEILKMADIISPWTVGRFNDVEQVREYASNRLKGDLEWSRKEGKEFMPVAYPGFSWSNLYPHDRFDRIPRQGGRFLWSQYAEYKQAGASMVYQAMFDEVDEGTAIFKIDPNPPPGPVKFLTLNGQPSDTYLWLVGEASKMIRGETRLHHSLPVRAPTGGITGSISADKGSQVQRDTLKEAEL